MIACCPLFDFHPSLQNASPATSSKPLHALVSSPIVPCLAAPLFFLLPVMIPAQWAYKAGSIEKEVYRPGDQHHLPFGVAKGYRMPVLSRAACPSETLTWTAGHVLGARVRAREHPEHDALRHLRHLLK
eukprot:760565-Hanusia_phi.AAC.2